MNSHRYYKVGQLFLQCGRKLDFSELNENDPVSDEVNDPTWKPTLKDSKHPSISKIKEKSKSNSLVHYISFFLVTLDNIHQEIWQKYLKMTTIVKENS